MGMYLDAPNALVVDPESIRMWSQPHNCAPVVSSARTWLGSFPASHMSSPSQKAVHSESIQESPRFRVAAGPSMGSVRTVA